MKNIKKIKQLLILVIAMTGAFISCKKDEQPNNGVPRIQYVRVTAPESSDSLLVSAGQGNLVAIIGENLENTVEVWFNDQKSSLTSTYITSTSILVSVPSPIPTVITNKLKLVFANRDTLLYDFKVSISEPLVSGMENEYTLTGDIATIRGDFFYEPLTVTFAGGATGELVSVQDKIIKVRVPAGATPGQVTVKTNFGETKSDFWFRDNRNIFISSDPFTGWWNASFVVSSPGAGDPPAINGNYIRVKKAIGAWSWMEIAGGPPDAMGDISKNVPDEAILKPADYNLKFELNTIKPYNGNVLKINVGLSNDFNANEYRWMPPYDTKGEWQTVTIPFEEIVKAYGAPLAVSAKGYYSRVWFHGPGDLDCDMSFDNFRIVPKVIKK
ncbi:glycan-binding surface protein [Ferruginibacter paludis]|uniref:glycan-binding surface protein n=1 Tax=Ferruginibacter paludis TaxID=1310417 RepID=UPI0025B2F034|nr:glycan-binding surface protein [Ferruginibacter paludis]MDN3655153.1 glycan-binding surface protein [Ferruginibacter paludis]